MRVAVFGGSFDPPHVCHVLAAAWALSTHGVAKVLVVPCFEHPFQKEMSPFNHRVAMATLAFSLFGRRVEVSRVEESLGRPSFTLKTLEYLATVHPDWELHLLVGSDILEERDRWHKFEEVQRLAPPLIVGRRGHGDAVLSLPDISSTRIRKMMAEGRDVAELVPTDVLLYARSHRLYEGR